MADTDAEATERPDEVEAPKPDGYTIGRWRDRPKYQCDACPYDTLKVEQIERHLVEAHAPPEPKREPVTVPLFDRFGNTITHREVS